MRAAASSRPRLACCGIGAAKVGGLGVIPQQGVLVVGHSSPCEVIPADSFHHVEREQPSVPRLCEPCIRTQTLTPHPPNPCAVERPSIRRRPGRSTRVSPWGAEPALAARNRSSRDLTGGSGLWTTAASASSRSALGNARDRVPFLRFLDSESRTTFDTAHRAVAPKINIFQPSHLALEHGHRR